jgi:GcrA cell cycle regulator
MLREENEAGSVWTDEKVAEMKRLWTEDGLSASDIAARLGPEFTRNMVLGKLHRLKARQNRTTTSGGQAKRGRVGTPGQSKANVIARRAESRRVAAERLELLSAARVQTHEGAWQPLHGLDPVAITELGPHDCRWPLGDPLLPGFGFCGLPQAGEHTRYCDVHHAMSVLRAAG